MWLHNPWLQLVLTAPVQFWCGASLSMPESPQARHTADGYWLSVRVRLTFILYSHLLSSVVYRSGSQTRRLLRSCSGHYYLDPAGTTLRIARDKLGSDCKLMGLQAKTARVIRNGREMDVPIAEVVLGDILVRPGEKFQWMEKLLRCFYH